MDITLFYREKGNGEPFVLLHGNGEDSSYFKHQIEYFCDRYRVIAPDTRGHGKSPRGTSPFTIRQFSCDLYDFMKNHQIPKAVILGFSDGANIAMRFAMKHPDMVTALILNGGNLDAKGVKRSTQLPIEIGYKIAKYFAKRSAEANKNAELLGLMVNDPNIEPEELAQITAPTLVICGTKDMIRRNLTGKWTGFWKAFKTIGERMIRKAEKKDLSRIAEILVFDKRMNYRSIFKNDDYSFHVLQVLDVAKEYAQPEILDHIFVYDDGIVKGLIHLEQTEIAEFYVDHFFQNQGIGAALMEYAKQEHRADHLWVLEKNERAIRFYEAHGFSLSGQRRLEAGTTEYVIKMLAIE